MRCVGDPTISSMGVAKRRRMPKSYLLPIVPVQCARCNGEFKLSERVIRMLNIDTWTCAPCKKKSKDDVRIAMLNLAKNKQKLKAGKK